MIAGIPRPVGIAFSANGAIRSKRDHLALPIKKEELIASAKLAVDAGAPLFCFTVRDSKGLYSTNPQEWADTLEDIREATASDIILQIQLDMENGATTSDFEAIIRTARPDAVQVRLDQILPPQGDDTQEKEAQDLLDVCGELGVGVQIALVQPGDIAWYCAFRNYGVIPEECRALVFLLGTDGEEPTSSPQSLRAFLDGLDKHNLMRRVVWSVAAYGIEETAALTAAMAFGGHIATGPAFNHLDIDGEEFASPSEQIKALADLANKLGRPTASAFEIRTLLFGAS